MWMRSRVRANWSRTSSQPVGSKSRELPSVLLRPSGVECYPEDAGGRGRTQKYTGLPEEGPS